MGIEEIRRLKENANLPKEKKRYTIPKVSKKTAARKLEEKKNADPELSQEAWFQEQRPQMPEKCENCGNPTCKNDDDWFRASICHILPKAYFPSVATHPLNRLFLCFWGANSCHTNMDNKTLDMTEMNCWNAIVERFLEIYPSISKEERRRIPSILMQYVNDNL